MSSRRQLLSPVVVCQCQRWSRTRRCDCQTALWAAKGLYWLWDLLGNLVSSVVLFGKPGLFCLTSTSRHSFSLGKHQRDVSGSKSPK